MLVLYCLCSTTGYAYVEKVTARARDLGVPFDGAPGDLNAITDVRGLTVGQTTLIEGEGKLVVGTGPIRTGVTAILPLGRDRINTPVPAAVYAFNGNGEMTGSDWIEESGFLEGPVLLTNTLSVGLVRDAVVEWGTKRFQDNDHFSLPTVAETWDGGLNDINGLHVTKEDVFHALDTASDGRVLEGNVGGGTGTRAFGFKAGIGTASRIVEERNGGFCVGVLVQANFGIRENLIIAGAPVGKDITDLQPVIHRDPEREGSILIVVATDAPLLPNQLKRVAKHATLGMARTGAISTNSSGDLFIAFSTAVPPLMNDREQWSTLQNGDLDPIFEATVSATEEAIINSLVAAKTMHGINNNTFYAIPHERLRAILRKYGRLIE
ncbi:MAG: P1 family peptidase [Verrucomicrobia bacterium]|nr:P1 family peptidase [Verrucomicrobiota bacterium]